MLMPRKASSATTRPLRAGGLGKDSAIGGLGSSAPRWAMPWGRRWMAMRQRRDRALDGVGDPPRLGEIEHRERLGAANECGEEWGHDGHLRAVLLERGELGGDLLIGEDQRHL